MDKIIITDAQYAVGSDGTNTCIIAKFNGEQFVVPLDATGNRHWEEIQRQVKEGTLTIQDAD